MNVEAYSVVEFCRRHGIARATAYNLWKRGEGPARMKVGRRTLISADAAAEWRQRIERQTGAPAILPRRMC
jgi:predicted DNA-binding transcriptional regulator AlpA